MRKRKWILILAGVLVLLQAGGYVAWRAGKADDRIRQILLQKVRPLLAEGTDIRRLRMSLGGVHLEGVRIVPKDSSFVFEIEDLRLGYSLWNLVRFGFNPQKVAQVVVLVHPVLVLREGSAAPAAPDTARTWSDTRSLIESFDTIRRISVSNAEVQIENAGGKRARLAKSLNGILETHPLDSAMLRLNGMLFESRKQNIALEGAMNLRAGKPRTIHVKVEESNPEENLYSVLPGYVDVQHGTIRAEGRFVESRGFSGYIELLDGRFQFKKAALRFEGVNVHGVFEGKGLRFSGAIDRFNGSRVHLDGAIQNLLDVRLDARAICRDFDLRRFFREMDPSLQGVDSRRARFSIHATGTPGNPQLAGEVLADTLSGFGIDFDRMRTDISLKDSLLVLRGIADKDSGLSLDAEAYVNLKDRAHISESTVNLHGSLLPLMPAWVRKRFAKADCGFRLIASGEPANPSGEASGWVTGTGRGPQTAAVSGQVRFKDRRWSVAVRSDEGFTTEGEVRNPFQTAAEWDLRSKGFPDLLGLAVDPERRLRTDSLRMESRFFGTPQKWEIGVGCSDPRRLEFKDVLEARCIQKRKDRNRRSIEFTGRYVGPSGEALPLAMEASITSQEAVLQKCELGNFLSAQATLPRAKNSGNRSVEVRVQGLDFASLHGVFPGMQPFTGQVNARTLWTGGEQPPSLRLDLSLRNGAFHQVEWFDGDLAVEWKDRKLRYFSVSLKKDGLPYLIGSILPLPNDSLGGSIQSSTLALGDLVKAVTGKPDVLRGEAAIHVKAGGTASRPIFLAEVDLQNGTLGSVAFREMKVVLTDTLLGPEGVSGGSLVVSKGSFRREDGVDASFWGIVPHGGSTPADLSFSVKGNLLGFLPETGSVFTKAEGAGELSVRLVGRPGRFRMAGGLVRLDQGKLELSSVTDRIEKIRVEAVLAEEDGFLQIQKCTGQIRGGSFWLTNSRVTGEPGLESFRIENLGLQFGVFRLATSARGVPLHIPGLMASGEKGWLAFSGFGKGEPFLIAGSKESPLVSGMISVSDNQLTYPFLSFSEGSDDTALDRLLDRLRWDVLVVPRKDVHYVRDMESPVGNVYVDLKLQDALGGIHLQGNLGDDSFTVWGNLVSSEGAIDALDRYFRPERIEFDYPKGGSPIFSGRAYTVISDSTGIPSTVWLNLVSIDQVTGLEEKQGPWGRVKFRFSSDNPNLGRNEADLLAAIGYSEGDIKNRAYDAIGMQVENRLFRPILRPLEKGMRRYLGFDMVKFSSMFSRNLFEIQNTQMATFDPKWLLRSSKLTLGKSFGSGFMVFYSGEVQNGYGYRFPMIGLGLRHSIALEYAIRPELMLEMEYTYDNQLMYERREDKRIWLRHVFPF